MSWSGMWSMLCGSIGWVLNGRKRCPTCLISKVLFSSCPFGWTIILTNSRERGANPWFVKLRFSFSSMLIVLQFCIAIFSWYTETCTFEISMPFSGDLLCSKEWGNVEALRLRKMITHLVVLTNRTEKARSGRAGVVVSCIWGWVRVNDDNFTIFSNRYAHCNTTSAAFQLG